MTAGSDDLLTYLLAAPDPVLVVSGRTSERVIACNAAARAFFSLEIDAALPLLRTLLPNVVARSIAVDASDPTSADHFVRAWAYHASGLTPVRVGALRLPPSLNDAFALTIRTETARLFEPSEAEVSEARLQFALDSAGIGDWDMDLRTNTAFRSRLHDACFGYGVAPVEWGYETFLAHVHPDDRERVDAAYTAARAGKADYDVEFRAVWPDGSIHWLWSKGRFYHDAAGSPIRVAGIQVDISARKAAEEHIALSAMAMASTTDAIVITDARSPDYPIVYVNEAFTTMTGYTAAEVTGTNCRFLRGSDGDQTEIGEIRSALVDGRATRVTLRNYRKDGTLFWNQLTMSPVRDGSGELTHYVGVLSDVTRSKHLEADLVFRATHDALTGLPNQRLIYERLEAALAEAESNGDAVGVAFVDIDRLKHVNDSLGHAGGDAFIREVGVRLSRGVRAIDTVARFGGDEFVIVLPRLAGPQTAERVLRRLREVLLAPLAIDDIELTPSASIGVALYPQDGTSAAELIRVADTAMYVAKNRERGSYQFFDPANMRVASDRLAREIALRRALERSEFVLHYQPIYAAAGERLVGLEALLRWQDPQRGLVMPGDFIPLAEESGAIVGIGAWVLEDVCAQIGRWRARGIEPPPVALNVSIAQLRRPDFIAMFNRTVSAARIEPRCLVIEITESIVMDNAERFVGILNELRREGARISIDDFGTGFSSLSYLKRLSLDTLKIDKSFVHDIATDVNAAAICQAIVTLGHSVGLRVLAEGVETFEQVAFLRAIGCDEVQGFFFARPASAAAIEALLLDDAAADRASNARR